MSAKQPWFERKFDFSFPFERYPDIVERLRGTPARVEELIRGLRPDILTRRDGETWSIQENIGHLIVVENLWLGRLEDFLAGEKTLRPADVTNRATHEADHNEQPIDAITSSFREVRRQWVDRLEALEDADFSRTALHPRLEVPMRLVDCCLFAADHDDYHLARMTELGRLFSS